VELDLQKATDAMFSVNEPRIATALAAIAANHCRHRVQGRVIGILRRWLDHPVTEVGALAALLLLRTRRQEGSSVEWLIRYAAKTDRPSEFAQILRNFMGVEALMRLAHAVPSLVWETVANDPRFGGMGQTHMPMSEPGRRFASLLGHQSWRAREFGAAIFAGDRSIPTVDKLPLLRDAEPRVRFRALEGMLLTSHEEPHSVDALIEELMSQCSADHEDRSWTVETTRDEPRVITVLCADDAVTRSSGTRTGGFGHSGLWDVSEWLDSANQRLTGLAVIYPNREIDDYLQREEVAYTRLARKKGHWTFRAAAASGIARVHEVQNLSSLRKRDA